MRDLIKDAKYYEDYLALNTKRLSRFQDQLKMLENDNVTGRQGCAAFIADLYRSRICALYSSGSCIRDIKELYPLYVALCRMRPIFDADQLTCPCPSFLPRRQSSFAILVCPAPCKYKSKIKRIAIENRYLIVFNGCPINFSGLNN